MSARFLLLVFALVGFFPPSPSFAQTPPPPGLRLPWWSAADADHAAAIRLNPASLAFQSSWDLRLIHSDSGTLFRGDTGDGDGLFVSFKPFSWLASGMALQFLYPIPAVDPRLSPNPGHLRLSWALAFQYQGWLALGFNVHAFVGDSKDIQSLVSFDIGAIWRPSNWFSLGLHLRDLTSPVQPSFTIPRTWEIGLAIRPLLDDRWTLSADVAIPEAASPPRFRYRLDTQPLPGWTLGLVATHDTTLRDIQVGLALGLSFGYGGVDLLGLAGISPPQDGRPASGRFDGLLAAVWAGGVQRGPLVRFGGKMPLFDLAGSLPERDLALSLSAGRPVFLQTLLALKRVADDPKVSGLLLRIGDLSCGFGKLQEIRALLQDIRKKGKTIVVYLMSGNLKSYYLAASANKIFLHPAGSLSITGLASTHLFFGQALSQIGVKPQFVRFGKFKTAPNRFTKDDLTPEHKEANQALLDDLYNDLTASIAQDRQTTPAAVHAWIKHGLFAATEAKALKLVDDLAFWDQIDVALQKSLDKTFAFDLAYFATPKAPARWHGSPQVAVISVDGTIVAGSNLDDPLFGVHLSGAQTLIQLLVRARLDPRIRAIVLRIDSPGGEVLASDLVWRYVEQVGRVKPIVVSMADIAASGGYYIAAPAREIFAQASTITGSIGIFAGKFDFSGLLQHVGIKAVIQKKGEMADLFSPYQAFSPEQAKRFRSYILLSYEDFLQKVAQGRKLKLEAVKAAAQGRVWSGQRALKLGLIDRIGGLLDAIDRARVLAGLAPDASVDILSLPQTPTWRLSLSRIPGLSSLLRSAQITAQIQGWADLLKRLSRPSLWALEPTSLTAFSL